MQRCTRCQSFRNALYTDQNTKPIVDGCGDLVAPGFFVKCGFQLPYALFCARPRRYHFCDRLSLPLLQQPRLLWAQPHVHCSVYSPLLYHLWSLGLRLPVARQPTDAARLQRKRPPLPITPLSALLCPACVRACMRLIASLSRRSFARRCQWRMAARALARRTCLSSCAPCTGCQSMHTCHCHCRAHRRCSRRALKSSTRSPRAACTSSTSLRAPC